MAIPVLIIGRSGAGKSTSMRNFGTDELCLVNVLGKPLPFRNKFSETLRTDSYKEISQTIADTGKRRIVIDDSGYLITNHFMKHHSKAGKGNEIFALYNDMGDCFWRLIERTRALPGGKTVYFIMHEDQNESGEVKPKTIGKLLDEKVCVEGMFTIVLRAVKDNGKYVFKTNSDGFDVAKSLLGMFDGDIDNDLKKVDDAIREYYGDEI